MKYETISFFLSTAPFRSRIHVLDEESAVIALPHAGCEVFAIKHAQHIAQYTY